MICCGVCTFHVLEKSSDVQSRLQIAAGEGEEDYSGIAKVIFNLAALNN